MRGGNCVIVSLCLLGCGLLDPLDAVNEPARRTPGGSAGNASNGGQTGNVAGQTSQAGGTETSAGSSGGGAGGAAGEGTGGSVVIDLGGMSNAGSTNAGQANAGGSSGGNGGNAGAASGGVGGTCVAAANEGGSFTGSTFDWATWPMPNAAGSGLPNPSAYDTGTAGVVLDEVTGLMWQDPESTMAFDWQGAIDHCAQLDHGGHTDWRLPSFVELISILDFTRYDPAIDPAFETTGETLWSSSLSSLGDGYYVGFFDGYSGTYDVTANLFHARCVR
jgi:hypothetical protein